MEGDRLTEMVAHGGSTVFLNMNFMMGTSQF